MRVVFLGKGGSGKTTCSSAFVKYMAKKIPHVLAIDADVNVHMQQALSFKSAPVAISDHTSEINEYLNETRKKRPSNILGTTPPASDSRFVRPSPTDPLLKKFIQFDPKKKISLMTVGKYEDEDVGVSCYHGKLTPLCSIMHHMLDTKDDLIVSDATAGTDIVATSLFFANDLNVYVIEPTQKSIKVVKDFIATAGNRPYELAVIVNKFMDGDLEFVHQHIDPSLIVGTIPFSRNMREFEQGNKEAFDGFIAENSSVFDAVADRASSITRDWEAYYRNLIEIHNKGCKLWWNDYYKTDLFESADPSFSYKNILEKNKKIAA